MTATTMTDTTPLLEVADIETCYGLSQVLFGRGGIMGLLGRSGRG